MTTRRTFLKASSAIYPATILTPLAAKAQSTYQAPKTFQRDYFKEIGVTPLINAAGGYSAFGGARMRPEVAEAIRYGTYNKAKVDDLHDAVGKRIAELAQTEAAMVPSGATAAMVLSTAACMTMGDKGKIEQLPDTTGLKNEVIIQKNHRYTYDRALIVAGAVLVEVADEDELRKAIGPKTAMMFWLLANHNPDGDSINMETYLAIAKEHNISTYLDGATMTPPASNVIDACNLGFDLVGFSGGKGLRGPYSTGLLLGKKDLVAYARANSSPNSRSLGRGMKVAPEEYIGMMIAFETALGINEKEDFARKRTIFSRMSDQMKNVPSLKQNVIVDEGMVNELYLDLDWDRSIIKMSNEEFIQELKAGNPSIRFRALKFAGGRIHVSSTALDEGQEIIVGKRINEVLMNRV
ncbi:MAG: selenocysteine synthase [Kordiimonadaceae bacterium]|jgi:uncharacterized pyridoxal phosphate-dependent enzyme|nr:selenocysteine synthase [Kordiimonadaceae bacterium]MBT6031953.1 selenocysteine synthase [Kordiimonadaceae bacterium]